MPLVVAFLDPPALLHWTSAVVAIGVAVLIFAGGSTSGGSFDPARQFGPLLFAERFTYLWTYPLGPLTGALILILLAGPWSCPTAAHMQLVRHTATRCGTHTSPASQDRRTRRQSLNPGISGVNPMRGPSQFPRRPARQRRTVRTARHNTTTTK